MIADHEDSESKPESNTFFEKLEHASQSQVSQAVIAQVMQKIAKKKKIISE